MAKHERFVVKMNGSFELAPLADGYTQLGGCPELVVHHERPRTRTGSGPAVSG